MNKKPCPCHFQMLFIRNTEPRDLMAEGMFMDCRRRADVIRERFNILGRMAPSFSVIADLGEIFIFPDYVPVEGVEQENFFSYISLTAIGLLQKLGAGEPVRTCTVLNMKSIPLIKGADGVKHPSSDPSETRDLVIITVFQKGQKRGAVIVFEEKMFLCEGGNIKKKLVVPEAVSMPHVDTMTPHIFDRMVLDGKPFEKAMEEMMDELKKETGEMTR